MALLKRIMILGVATIAMVGALGGAAEAGGGLGWAGFGGAAPPYYLGGRSYYGSFYYGGNYGYPYYGYYGGGFEGCFMRRRVVGYTRHERPIVKRVRVCY